MVRFGSITKHPTWGWHSYVSYVSYVHISLILPLSQYQGLQTWAAQLLKVQGERRRTMHQGLAEGQLKLRHSMAWFKG